MSLFLVNVLGIGEKKEDLGAEIFCLDLFKDIRFV